MKTMQELFELTTQWSYDRGILTNGNILTQTLKLVSEVGELVNNSILNRCVKDDLGDCLVVLTNISYLSGRSLLSILSDDYDVSMDSVYYNLDAKVPSYPAAMASVEIGILADVVAKGSNLDTHIYKFFEVLAGVAKEEGVCLVECWSQAYDDIKDRKGFLNADGIFIKESDPAYNQLRMEFEKDEK